MLELQRTEQFGANNGSESGELQEQHPVDFVSTFLESIYDIQSLTTSELSYSPQTPGVAYGTFVNSRTASEIYSDYPVLVEVDQRVRTRIVRTLVRQALRAANVQQTLVLDQPSFLERGPRLSSGRTESSSGSSLQVQTERVGKSRKLSIFEQELFAELPEINHESALKRSNDLSKIAQQCFLNSALGGNGQRAAIYLIATRKPVLDRNAEITKLELAFSSQKQWTLFRSMTEHKYQLAVPATIPEHLALNSAQLIQQLRNLTVATEGSQTASLGKSASVVQPVEQTHIAASDQLPIEHCLIGLIDPREPGNQNYESILKLLKHPLSPRDGLAGYSIWNEFSWGSLIERGFLQTFYRDHMKGHYDYRRRTISKLQVFSQNVTQTAIQLPPELFEDLLYWPEDPLKARLGQEMVDGLYVLYCVAAYGARASSQVEGLSNYHQLNYLTEILAQSPKAFHDGHKRILEGMLTIHSQINELKVQNHYQ